MHRFLDECQNWYWKSPDRVARRISPLQYRLAGVEGVQVRVLPIHEYGYIISENSSE